MYTIPSESHISRKCSSGHSAILPRSCSFPDEKCVLTTHGCTGALPPSTENEWRLIPFTTSLVPFRYTPSCGKNSTVRKPILVSRVWNHLFLPVISTQTSYIQVRIFCGPGLNVCPLSFYLLFLPESVIFLESADCPVFVRTVFPSFRPRTDTWSSYPFASPYISHEAWNLPCWSALSTKCSMCTCGTTSSHTGR